MRLLPLLIIASLLAACASPRPEILAGHLLHDQQFVASSSAGKAETIFAVSPAMQEYVDTILIKQMHDKGPRVGLFEALRDKAALKIEYDSVMTKNAEQAFDTRAGNCLSLVIMTAAFAKHLGLEVQYQDVMTEETWSRSGNLHFSSGHVNIVIGKKIHSASRGYDANESMVIDFIPPEDLRKQRAKLIDEKTIVAMYFNNRAAELLANQQVNEAYWFARAAIMQDPNFLNAYNTLGVIYMNHNNLAQAEQVFKEILAREENSTSVLHNLVSVLSQQGHQSEADLWKRQLDKLQPYPPFYYFDLGKLAMDAGDYKKAKTMFNKELDRDPYYHEFHFWLALAHYKLGELTLAGEHLSSAKDFSTTRQSQDLYGAKLEKIKSYQLH
jgi:Tfp pilus assembly protein PilF